MKVIAALAIMTSLTLGCNRVSDSCEGLHTYNANEWSNDEITALQKAASLINNFFDMPDAPITVVREGLPSELQSGTCMIAKGRLGKTSENTEYNAMHYSLSGNIVIDVSKIVNDAKYDTQEKVNNRITSLAAHELLHGYGFDHTNKGDVMWSGGMNNLPSLGFGPGDKAQCQDLGYCVIH